MNKPYRICPGFMFILLALMLAVSVFPGTASGAEDRFLVSLPKTVKGYTPCEIRITAPVAGDAVLRLYDAKKNPWLVLHASVHPGENTLPWNGLGEHLERLFAGPYHFDATLNGEDGLSRTATARFKISGTTPALVYALPSSETLYLDGSEDWFVECYVSFECTVAMEIRNESGVLCTREERFGDVDGGGGQFRWKGSLGRNETIPPGEYTVLLHSLPNPDYTVSFPLHVLESRPGVPEVKETGPIVPERGMSDAEIWEFMMKPSVVLADFGADTDRNLYAAPSARSRVAATLGSDTQALEVLGFEGGWARVRAWSHMDGQAAAGYIRKSALTVCTPGTHYGLLIDKQDQTMAVYRDGQKIAVMPVSTGKPTKKAPSRETPAGAFLTDLRMGASFAQAGYRYEYPIRYDGVNIIHGLGYVRTGRVRDYSHNLPLLGQKASHGCVRVSPFVTESCPINIYWLWTHLPYHTRVIILE